MEWKSDLIIAACYLKQTEIRPMLDEFQHHVEMTFVSSFEESGCAVLEQKKPAIKIDFAKKEYWVYN